MDEVTMLSDRETASGILLLAFAVVLFAVPKTRRSLLPDVASIARQLVGPKVLGPFLALFAWAALCVCIAARFRAWDVGLLKDTVLTVLLVGVPQVVFAATRAESGGDIVRHLRRETIGLGVFAIAYVNLVSFPLWLELVAQAAAALALVCEAVGKSQQQGAACAGIAGRGLLVVIGAGSIAWTTVQLVQQAAVFGWWSALASLILTVWLPLALVPFLYTFGFVAATEVAWLRLTFPRHTDLSRKVFLAVLVGLRLRVSLAKKFPGRHRDVVEATGFRDALARMSAFRRDVQQREDAEQYRLGILEQFAGVSGTDDQGLQRDRREFQATKDALNEIWWVEEGQYRRAGRYWEALSTPYEFIRWQQHGLPKAHNMVVETTLDGQAWRAYRLLPNGWCLGMAGNWKPPSLPWFYSGARAPTTWPADSSAEWLSEADGERQPDWEYDDSSRA